MFIYCLLLVMSVFLGSQILAVTTPVAQVTIYRLLALAAPFLLAWQVWHKNRSLLYLPRSAASRMLAVYLLWWLISLFSGLWAVNFKSWLQVFFLMTVGISAILALYFWVHSYQDWLRLCQGAWVIMSGLVLWGYFELLTNRYIFADLNKLDKYDTFSSQPWTRIPITHFANQNDYATMLLAYLILSLILYQLCRRFWQRGIYLVFMLLASLLIYQSGSRMSLLCLLMIIGYLFLNQFSWSASKPWLKRLFIFFGLVLIFALVFVGPLREKLSSIIYFQGPQAELSGDTKRMNIWRNGLLFLTETFGFGVGSGNIEYWSRVRGFWPTNEITNMHNWWLEILVSNGILAFVLYVWGYFNLTRRFTVLARTSKDPQIRTISQIFLIFLMIFILASITSANNMLIEWHWLFFGLIISYLKIVDSQELLKKNRRKTL